MRIKGLNTSRGWTIESVSDPTDTILAPMMQCRASSPQTRNCSRSSPAKSGLNIAAALTESHIGTEGGTARLSRTSVTRNRGTRYAFLNFGCRVPFELSCEPLTAMSASFIKMYLAPPFTTRGWGVDEEGGMARSRGTGLNGRDPRGRHREGLAAALQRQLAPTGMPSESNAGSDAGAPLGGGGLVRLSH